MDTIPHSMNYLHELGLKRSSPASTWYSRNGQPLYSKSTEPIQETHVIATSLMSSGFWEAETETEEEFEDESFPCRDLSESYNRRLRNRGLNMIETIPVQSDNSNRMRINISLTNSTTSRLQTSSDPVPGGNSVNMTILSLPNSPIKATSLNSTTDVTPTRSIVASPTECLQREFVVEWSDEEDDSVGLEVMESLKPAPFRLCRATDESDTDETEVDADCPPKTKLEAALRRARLKEKKRKLNRTSDLKEHQTDKLDQTEKIPSLNVPDVPITEENVEKRETTTNAKEETNDNTQEKDFCSGMESWLQSRPRRLYGTRQSPKRHALQLCFLSQSSEDIEASESDSSSRSDYPVVDEMNPDQEVNDSPPEQEMVPLEVIESPNVHMSRDISPILDEPSDNPGQTIDSFDSGLDEVVSKKTPLPKMRCHSSLLLEDERTVTMMQKLAEINRYCSLFFEQAKQECSLGETGSALSRRVERHNSIQKSTQLALEQSPKMAHMQLEVERYPWKILTPEMSKQLDLRPKCRAPLSRDVLCQLSVEQLRHVQDGLLSVIENLNTVLVNDLAERDDLYLEQGAKTTDLEDMAAYFKDLCIRASIRQFRRQTPGHNSEPVTTFDSNHPIFRKPNPPQDTRRAHDMKNRIVRAVFNRSASTGWFS